MKITLHFKLKLINIAKIVVRGQTCTLL